MKRKVLFLGSLVFVLFSCNFITQKETIHMSMYSVSRLNQPMKNDADWNKSQWKNTKGISINNRMGDKPVFTPVVEAKMMYDNENLYVIFYVNDKFIRCKITDYNGPVYEEPAVEFFFSPDPEFPERYFNLEINCGGTPLMHYNDYSSKKRNPLDIEDIKKVEIAHSLPHVVDPEITDPVTWTVEYKIPLAMLEKYSKVLYPKPGIEWRANFYKIAEKGSNIHFLTWSVVDNPVPDFHLPRFFGNLKFE